MAKSNDRICMTHQRPDGVSALDGLRAVNEQIPSDYERSLKTARDRNRRRLPRQASPEALARQRMEQGFTLYFRGANQRRRHPPPPQDARAAPQTAGGSHQKRNSGGATYRAKTAPDDSPGGGRRKWQRPSNLRLCGLDRADYTEDFEPDYDSDWDSSSGEEVEEAYDSVMLSLDDVKTLRKSLSLFGQKLSLRDSVTELDDLVEEIAEEVRTDPNGDEGPVVVLELLRPALSREEKAVPEDETKTTECEKEAMAREKQAVKEAMARENQAVKEAMALEAVKEAMAREKEAMALEAVKEAMALEAVKEANALPPGASRLQLLIQRALQMPDNQQQRLASALGTIEAHASMEYPGFSVELELQSNWGHPSKIGLTEVEFYDRSRQLIQVGQVELVMSDGTRISEQQLPSLANLTNGRRKTTKERHMWSSDHRLPLQLMFRLKAEPCELARIVVWNFNNTLRNVDAGVRECRISCGGKLVFDGDIEKGCGNQVFDYSTTVHLDQGSNEAENREWIEAESPSFSEEDALCSAAAMHRSLEERATSRTEKALSPKSEEAPINKTQAEKKKVATPRPGKTPHEGLKSPTHPEKIPLKHSKAVQERKAVLSCSTDDDDCLLHQLQEYRRSKGGKDSPAWLRQPNGAVAAFKKGSLGLTGWPAVAGRRHLQTDLDKEAEEAEESKEARFGRRSRSGRGSAAAGSGSEEEEAGGTPMQRLLSSRSERRKLAEARQPNLEASWSSLNFFDKFHAGRISTDFQGDALDECLQRFRDSGPLPEEEEGQEEEDEGLWSDEEFCIPELPVGRELLLNIRTTWGDRHYVGLTGIEVFGADGEPCEVVSITADPADINVLPDYSSDPRVVTNLIDGVNRTRDDTHMWLAPFSPGRPHLVRLTFARPSRLALMRIWNYNKSRIHSSRGACDVEIQLDDRFIFKGEVARAGGNEAGETILFTTDEAILERVAANDEACPAEEAEEEDQVVRPATADRGEGSEAKTARPFTCAARKKALETGSRLRFDFTATWGDQHYLGLTGLEVLGSDGEALPLRQQQLSACPRDMRVLTGCEGDSRTLDKLVDGVTLTTEDVHMWMVPFTEGSSHVLEVQLPGPTPLSGFRVWNYNKSSEDTFRGVRTAHLFIDDRRVSPPDGFVLRRAPGSCPYDFAQDVLLGDSARHAADQEGGPCGFVFRLDLLSTWGDPYYVGLTGLEVVDPHGRPIPLSSNHVAAVPPDVNVLPGMEGDVRTPDKLVDGVVDGGGDGLHSWLAPVLPDITTRVFVIFDFPVAVGAVHLWNYAKTPQRGVRDFSLLIDDLLVFSGTLPSVGTSARGILPTASAPIPRWAVLLGDNADLSRLEPAGAVLNGQANAGEQDVMLTNDRQVVERYAKPPERVPDPQLRPKTSVTKPRGAHRRR